MATGRVPTTANSPLTAKGDLFGYSTTQARVPVGNDGETLVADSSTSTGLRYQEPLNLNPILNSGFDIWQRGTASTAIGSGTFLADRWQAARGGFAAGGSQSQQVTGDTTNLPNIQYCLRIQRDSGNTNTASMVVGQNLENVNSIPYAGKTVTLSFYARAGANFSASGNTLTALFCSGTGTNQNLVTGGFTGQNNTALAPTLTTTWQRFSITKTIDTNATQLGFIVYDVPTGTAGANDYYEITGVMINVGSVAYPFRRTTGTIQGELAACQRYYEVTGGGSTGRNNSTTTTELAVTFKVNKRTTPSMSIFTSSPKIYDPAVGTKTGSGSVISQPISPTTTGTVVGVNGFTGLTSGNLIFSHDTDFVVASAEL
jgi:hypothetical protein